MNVRNIFLHRKGNSLAGNVSKNVTFFKESKFSSSQYETLATAPHL
jgi:hypothetical protein